MTKVLVVPVLAAVLFAAACGGDGGSTEPTQVGPTANVRFFNATTGMTGSGGFTTNGQFATGSALAFGQATQTCSKVNAGSTSFGFGAASTGGTGLSGNALATLNGQNLTAGGNYTLVATGSATSPKLFLLADSLANTPGASQTAVRFVNLAPGASTTANTFVVFSGAFGSPSQTPIATNLAVGSPSAFRTMTSGANTLSVIQNPGHNPVIPSNTVTLQAGTVNTVAIVPTATTTIGYQLITIPRC